ncbi:hypothetical protein [Bosea minatitlanensis]|uniref:Uncharacterized protein n=1 Tax=Bosea minatitlanensis TaxID=128782 RepID=A0ABW0F1S1_9HYPH|nr:hypothetical protein [Bosea minatitlanensis]MCT4495560.1 hypothetical protein [Bosea minatitlanensis]
MIGGTLNALVALFVVTVAHAGERVSPFVDKFGTVLAVDWRVHGSRLKHFAEIAGHHLPVPR